MSIKSRSGRKVHMPTAEEDASIEADAESPELSAEFFAKSKTVAEALGADVAGELAAIKRPRGRPAGSVGERTKVVVSMRVDPDVLEALRSTGAGWQTRVNELLRREFVRAR